MNRYEVRMGPQHQITPLLKNEGEAMAYAIGWCKGNAFSYMGNSDFTMPKITIRRIESKEELS